MYFCHIPVFLVFKLSRSFSLQFVVCIWWMLRQQNCFGFVSFSAVMVKCLLRCCAEDLLPFGFPSIDMGPQLKVVERTRTATMLCAASGIPDPEISWFKDFLPVEPALSQGRIKQLRSGTTDTSETLSSHEKPLVWRVSDALWWWGRDSSASTEWRQWLWD